jgi:hypothetical protein
MGWTAQDPRTETRGTSGLRGAQAAGTITITTLNTNHGSTYNMKKHLKKMAGWITPCRVIVICLTWLEYLKDIRIDFHRPW